MGLQENARSFINQQHRFLKENKDRLSIDADTHITDVSNLPGELKQKLNANEWYYHGRPISCEQLLMEMEISEIDMSLAWQNPAATVYTDNKKHNYNALLEANRYIALSAGNHHTKLIPAGWTDPRALGVDQAVHLAQQCVLEFGFPVVKMNPAQNEYFIDDPISIKVTDAIVELGAVPAFHFGADTIYTPPEGLEKIVARYSGDTNIIAVHMGGGGASYLEAEQVYQKSRQLGLTYPNIHFILSAKRDAHVESDFIAYQTAGEPYTRSLSCGSDAPYGKQTWNFGGFRCMLEGFLKHENHPDARIRNSPGLFTKDSMVNYMGRNLACLVMNAYEKILDSAL
ncbi:MAG: amidohydrolase family protein [Spirochaetota bacterium]